MRTVRSTFETDGCGIGHDAACGYEFDLHLKITVIHTNPEGTLQALKLASGLARDLRVHIELVAVQLVPFRLSLEEPLVSTNFLHQRLSTLAPKAGLGDDEVTVRIYLCRDGKQALAKFLPPRSLVVIGGLRHWWRPEQKLEKWLLRIHHQVLFAEVDKKRQALFHRRLSFFHISP